MYAYAVMYICINGRARKKSNYEAHDRRCYEHSPKVVGEQYYPLVAVYLEERPDIVLLVFFQTF